MTFSLFDTIALLSFLGSWIGYTRYTKKKAKTTNCIARCLHQHRIHWMYELMTRSVRVGDAAMLANLERNIAFFASTTLLVLAGVLTLFSQTEKLEAVIATIPYTAEPIHDLIQIKLALLAGIFVLAFFQLTWSMRQYGFLNVMIGAAPLDESGQNESMLKYAKQMAIVQDQAAHAYNYGLRSYYFAMAALCWFFHPLLFILASGIVVYTLYMREFKSKAVIAITQGMKLLEQKSKDDTEK